MPNKLNEIKKPKLNKEEAKTLAKLIYRRFAEILEKNEHLCIGDDCEDCHYSGDGCDFIDKSFSEMSDVVELISKALGVHVYTDWDGDSIILKISGIKPDEDDDDYVFSHTLRAGIYAMPSLLKNVDDDDLDFEPETIADIREEWRRANNLIRELWLKEDLPAFFGNFEKALKLLTILHDIIKVEEGGRCLMVMIFKSKKALDFLLKHGEVVTFRLHERKAGKDWITDKRGGKKIADVEVILFEEVRMPSYRASEFQKYVNKSGFDSVKEWWDEIAKINGFSKFMNAEKGYFYLVRLLHGVVS